MPIYLPKESEFESRARPIGRVAHVKIVGKQTLIENDSDGVDLVRKAVNLFTFLGSTQQLLIKPVHTVDKFEQVMWFADLPDHPAVRSAHRTANPEPDLPLLEVDRVLRLDPPAIPAELELWVAGPIDDADREPTIRELFICAAGTLSGAGSQPSLRSTACISELSTCSGINIARVAGLAPSISSSSAALSPALNAALSLSASTRKYG
jgi:hypothetical protein